MARLTKEQKQQERLEKRIASQRAMEERARANQLAKMNDPVWRAAQAEKQNQRQSQARIRALAKANTPEARAERDRKAKAKLENQSLASIVKSAPARRKLGSGFGQKSDQIKSSKGLKGRTPTAAEAKMADKLGTLPCICCSVLKERGLITANLENDGQFNNVSLHHSDGRTKPKAHFKQLPLCAYHHDVPIPKELQSHPEYKYLVPVHSKGNWGGKAAFNALFGSERALLERCYKLIGEHDFYVSELS